MEVDIFKMLAGAGDVPTLGLLFFVYYNSSKLRLWVAKQLKPIETSITEIKTTLKPKGLDHG